MIKAVGAFLVVAAFLGVRGAAREAALPFDGLDRLIQPRVARFDSAPESSIEFPPLSEITFENSSESEGETGNMSELIDKTPDKSTWDSWRSQTIAALPAELRANSDYRQAIDAYYFSSIGAAEDEFTVDIISRPPIGGYDIGGVSFTDIDDRTNQPPVEVIGFAPPDPPISAELEAQNQWIATWDEWLNHVTETVDPIDANYLKLLVTTYGELVAMGAPAPTEQDLTWRAIAIEAKLSRKK